MTVVPPLSPPPRDSPVRAPCLQTLCPPVHPSLSSSCLLSVHFSFSSRRPPQKRRLSPAVCPPGWRPVPKTAPGVLSKCPDDGCGRAPPPDLCGWQYLVRVLVEGLRRRRPPDGRVVLNASRHTDRSIFRALDTPRSSRPPQWSGVPRLSSLRQSSPW